MEPEPNKDDDPHTIMKQLQDKAVEVNNIRAKLNEQKDKLANLTISIEKKAKQTHQALKDKEKQLKELEKSLKAREEELFQREEQLNQYIANGQQGNYLQLSNDYSKLQTQYEQLLNTYTAYKQHVEVNEATIQYNDQERIRLAQQSQSLQQRETQLNNWFIGEKSKFDTELNIQRQQFLKDSQQEKESILKGKESLRLQSAELRRREEQIEKREEELDQSETAIQTRLKDIETAESSLNSTKREYEERLLSLEEEKKQVEQRELDIDNIIKEKENSLLNEKKEIEEQRRSYLQKKNNDEKQLLEKQKELESKSMLLDQREKKIDSSESEMVQKRQELLQFIDQVKQGHESVIQSEYDLNQLKNDYKKKLDELNNREQTISTREKDAFELKSNYDHLLDSYSQLTKVNESLKQQLLDQTQKNNEISQQSNKNNEVISYFQTQAELERKNSEQLKSTFLSLSSQLQEKDVSLEQATNSINELNQIILNQKEIIDKQNNDIFTLQQQVTQTSNTLDDLHKEYTQLRDSFYEYKKQNALTVAPNQTEKQTSSGPQFITTAPTPFSTNTSFLPPSVPLTIPSQVYKSFIQQKETQNQGNSLSNRNNNNSATTNQLVTVPNQQISPDYISVSYKSLKSRYINFTSITKDIIPKLKQHYNNQLPPSVQQLIDSIEREKNGFDSIMSQFSQSLLQPVSSTSLLQQMNYIQSLNPILGHIDTYLSSLQEQARKNGISTSHISLSDSSDMSLTLDTDTSNTQSFSINQNTLTPIHEESQDSNNN
ncbi:hypothetical protein WA158_002111 [Blastocystis sp. Blastoise]